MFEKNQGRHHEQPVDSARNHSQRLWGKHFPAIPARKKQVRLIFLCVKLIHLKNSALSVQVSRSELKQEINALPFAQQHALSVFGVEDAVSVIVFQKVQPYSAQAASEYRCDSSAH